MIVAHPSDCECIICKVRSLSIRTAHPTHVKKDDPWEGNPVNERIEELQKEGVKNMTVIQTGE